VVSFISDSAAVTKYDYEAPIWAVVLLCFSAIAIAFLCFIAVLYWDRWAEEDPIIIRWFLLLIGLGFLIAGIRPRNWKPWRYFYADSDGIHFPSECPDTKGTTWLIVPWERVGNIKKEMFYNRRKGPSIELRLQEEEITKFFHDVKLTKMFFGMNVLENGFFKVGYSNAFKSADEAVRILNDFKSRRGE
jgi:hypothetical protein